MVKHIVVYTLKEGVDKEEAVKLIASKLEPLVGKIPGLKHMEVKLAFNSMDYALYSEFDSREDLEQTVVMCGFGATVGRSLLSNRMPRLEKGQPWDFGFPLMEEYTPLGLQFGQQFDKAIERDPPLIMITGWNEWITGRWDNVGAGAGAGGQVIAGQYTVSATPGDRETTYFVDSFNPEYSRDIEPMKGGFGDNYLYQMAERLREYKGTRNIETAFGQWAIDIHGSVGQWYAVGPESRDYEGDVTHRLSPGHVGGKEYGFYMNNSGRNDIVTAKVSNDSAYLYFYVECADDITDPEGANWMNLFINADCDDATGWYGFDYIINRNRTDNALLVEKFVGKDTWEFETVGSVAYTRVGNVMQVKIPKAMIGFTDTMDFKWADNSTPTGQIMEFLDQGDAAPNGRYTYRFTLTEQAVKYPTELKSDLSAMVVLKSRSYNAFVGGKQTRLVEDNTKGVLLASGVKIYEYTPGFVHAKVFCADGREAVVGTINLDYRSLVHHYEDAVWIYGSPAVADIKSEFLKTVSVSPMPMSLTVPGSLSKTVSS